MARAVGRALDRFTFDGKEVPFKQTDTYASALHRAGILELSRSMKYHRARGAFCFSGGCAGCLVAIDGGPNRLACMERATPATVESQNRIGSAKRDLLAVTDKVYRRGFDPHGAFTKPRLLNRAFLIAVRFMSGVGKVPKTAGTKPAKRHTLAVDELIIGGGRRGVERAQSSTGHVVLIDERGQVAATPDHVEVWTDSLAFGIYDDVVGVRRGRDLWEVRAKRITIAAGDHDGWPLFANNDLPGVMSRRGAERLVQEHGVAPGSRIVVHGQHGPAGCEDAVVAQGVVSAAKGGTRVEQACVDGKWIACDAIVCDVNGSPRVELMQQAGCKLTFANGALRPVLNDGQTTRKDVWVA